MPKRERTIIETAVNLAERGGFEAVRLRDVAAESGIGLGTLYAHFKSKEDILLAAVQQEVEKLAAVLDAAAMPATTALDRVAWFFALSTRALLARPNFARAVLRALGGGDQKSAERVYQFHGLVTRMIIACLRGVRASEVGDDLAPGESRVGFLLQQIWFAALVGWNIGMQTEQDIVSYMRDSASLLLDGLRAQEIRDA